MRAALSALLRPGSSRAQDGQPPPRRRATDRPLTVRRLRQGYESPASFTKLLPWMEYLPDSRSILLEDGMSVAAVLELTPAACEARPAVYLEQLHAKLRSTLVYALPEEHVPWVLQTYVQAEPVGAALLDHVRDYVSAPARETPFSAAWIDVLEAHLRRLSNPKGHFVDNEVTGSPWRARLLRVRMVLYRRLPRSWRSAQGLTPEQELGVAVERLREALGAAGIASGSATGATSTNGCCAGSIRARRSPTATPRRC